VEVHTINGMTAKKWARARVVSKIQMHEILDFSLIVGGKNVIYPERKFVIKYDRRAKMIL
jgi:hypothetical protein